MSFHRNHSDPIWSIHPPALLSLHQSGVMRFDHAPRLSMRFETRPRACMDDGCEDNPSDPPPVVPVQRMGSVAIVHINGVFIADADWIDAYFGFTGTRQITEIVRQLAAMPDVSATVLAIDSPGGSCLALDGLAEAIIAHRNLKPIIAQSKGLIASAGYYAAAGCTSIYAGRMDMIGSIGTIIPLYDWSKYFADLGIKPVPITSAPEGRDFKSTGMPGTELTEDQQAYLQGIVDFYFADFKSVVLAGRGQRLTADQFAAVADGRVFMGPESQRLGLVDGIQSLDVTVNQLLSTASLTQATASARTRVARASLAQR